MSVFNVRRATEHDLEAIATINANVFLGDRNNRESALEWIVCWFRSFPLYQYFVICDSNDVFGYIGWQIHGGFLRAEPVVELDQIGIDPISQGKKLGPILLRESLQEIIGWLKQRNNRIESHISAVVWSYTLNLNAMKIYADFFTDGPVGMRVQFGNRAETLFRIRIPIVRPVREQS